MASTTTKRTWADAKADAEAFRTMFGDCYERWEFAGSLRRKCPEASDVEHVIVPRYESKPVGGMLFGGVQRTNLLWEKLDAWLAHGDVQKHWYGNGHRWGERYRGVDFRGFNHEIFCADADNFGAILLIRTGPAEYSQRVVTAFRDGGMYLQKDGYCVHAASGERVKVPDEAAYVRLAGLPYLEPEARR